MSLLRRRFGEGTSELPRSFSDADVHSAYEAHAAELFAVARRSLGDVGLAQEAVQETFVRAWRASERFDPSIASLRTWLFAILRSVIIDLARKRGRRFGLASNAEIDGDELRSAGDDRFDRVLSQWVLEQALGRLREEHRLVVLGVHRDGRTAVELAAEFGIPEGTVRSRLYYGIRALRLALEELGWRDD